MHINFYKLLLDSLIPSFVLNENYNKVLLENKRFMSSKEFNNNFRIFSLDLGRRQGASTAIKNFIISHPNLNIILITTHVMFKSQYEKDLIGCKNYSVCHKKDSLLGKISPADIIIFDNFNLLASNKLYKELDELVLDKLNSDNNKINQIYVKFQ